MAAAMIAYGAMAGLQLAGGYHAAQNMKNTAELNSDIADMNAEFAELDAHDAIIQGQSTQARYQANIDKVLATQQLRLTAANVDVKYGSARAIQQETRFLGQLNKMEIEKQAQEKAMGFKNQASQFRTQGFMQESQARAKARSLMFQSVLGAAQTGLAGAEKAGAFKYSPSSSGYGDPGPLSSDTPTSLNGTSQLQMLEDLGRTS